MKKHIANIITGCRIICSILLLFTSAFSPLFYFLYITAGITDMTDGTIARKTNTDCEFGSKLDTAADAVFILACMIQLLPVMKIPVWLCVWTGVIAAVKIFNFISGYCIQKKLTAKHTVLNKLTGALLFILPFTLPVLDLKYSGSVVCTIAAIAAVHEGYLVITDKHN